jgi:hypothetical protein
MFGINLKWVGIGYALFMLLFFFIGVTKARFETFVAVAALTAIYVALVYVVSKIYYGNRL